MQTKKNKTVNSVRLRSTAAVLSLLSTQTCRLAQEMFLGQLSVSQMTPDQLCPTNTLFRLVSRLPEGLKWIRPKLIPPVNIVFLAQIQCNKHAFSSLRGGGGVQFLFVIRTWCIQVQNHSVLAPWKTLCFFFFFLILIYNNTTPNQRTTKMR